MRMNNIETIEIMTESDAWMLLEYTLVGKILPIDYEAFHLKIGSWPVLRFKVDGDKFHSSVNSKMMVAFLELQANIYRTYAKIKYDEAKGRLLCNGDKAALELIIKVQQGSSDITADLAEIGKKFIEGAISKMNGNNLVILGLTGILALAGTPIINGYLAQQTEQKKIDAQIRLSKEETRRLELMKEASKQVPYVGTNIVLTEEVVNKIFKSASTANSITIGGHTFNKQQINELIRPERSTSREVRLDGEYRILKVDSSKINFFKVELQSNEGKRFWAVLQDATVTKEMNKELLQAAEWNKTPINLVINGTEVKGEISSASIIDVKDRYLAKK